MAATQTLVYSAALAVNYSYKTATFTADYQPGVAVIMAATDDQMFTSATFNGAAVSPLATSSTRYQGALYVIPIATAGTYTFTVSYPYNNVVALWGWSITGVKPTPTSYFALNYPAYPNEDTPISGSPLTFPAGGIAVSGFYTAGGGTENGGNTIWSAPFVEQFDLTFSNVSKNYTSGAYSTSPGTPSFTGQRYSGPIIMGAAFEPTGTATTAIAAAAASHPHTAPSPALAGRAVLAPNSVSQPEAATSPSLAGRASVSPSPASQLPALTSPTISARSATFPGNAVQAASATSSGLTPGFAVAAVSSAQAQSTSLPVLLPAVAVSPLPAVLEQSPSEPGLSGRSSVSAVSTAQAQSASTGPLSAGGSLAVDNAALAQVMTAISVTYRSFAAPVSAWQQHTAAATMVQAGGSLVPALGLLLHVAAPAPLTMRPAVAPGSAQQPNSTTGATLGISVAVDAAVQARITTPVSLLARNLVAVIGGRHPHIVTAPVIIGSSFEFEIAPERRFRVPARPRTFAVEARLRRWFVPARPRTFTIRKGLCMSSITKFAAEERAYEADWTADLDGQTLVGTITATCSDPQLVVDRITHDDAVMRFWLSGGTANKTGTVQFLAQTSGGEELVWQQRVTCY